MNSNTRFKVFFTIINKLVVIQICFFVINNTI